MPPRRVSMALRVINMPPRVIKMHLKEISVPPWGIQHAP